MASTSKAWTSNKWFALYVFCFLPVQLSFAQTQKAADEAVHRQKLTVKVLDGVTGLPMWFEFPNVWIGSADDAVSRLDIKGEAQFEVSNAKPRVIRVSSNWYADCRYPGDARDAGSKVEYSIDEILERGVVAENVCGSRHAKPTPGAIILYMRQRTFKEVVAL
jgi:hypothetical protein